MVYLAFIAVLALALIHIHAFRITSFAIIPRSYWLSIAGGAAISYVFVHVLPDLSESQEAIETSTRFGLDFVDRYTNFVALVGLVSLYGLERWVQFNKRTQNPTIAATDNGIFWVHIGSFAVYNALVGYVLLHRGALDHTQLIAFSVAMALHILITDNELREQHKAIYHDRGRWLLAGAVITGWIIGLLIEVNEDLVSILFAFIAGGVILHVLKSQVPENRESRYWAFAAGATGYATLLLLAG